MMLVMRRNVVLDNNTRLMHFLKGSPKTEVV